MSWQLFAIVYKSKPNKASGHGGCHKKDDKEVKNTRRHATEPTSILESSSRPSFDNYVSSRLPAGYTLPLMAVDNISRSLVFSCRPSSYLRQLGTAKKHEHVTKFCTPYISKICSSQTYSCESNKCYLCEKWCRSSGWQLQ